MIRGVTLDAGALIALDRRDRRVVTLVREVEAAEGRITVPATALSQALRSPVRQARLMRLLRQPRTDTVALDRVDAAKVGQLLAATGTADIADAHVVVCARRAGTPVATSDADDLRRLDLAIAVIDL
ncbi:MAG TPA: PIN domain-containing protein [Acidimicrobiales bacterium]|nr:PIN domain-containing protein [Acidimicrobiales bacterium]